MKQNIKHTVANTDIKTLGIFARTHSKGGCLFFEKVVDIFNICCAAVLLFLPSLLTYGYILSGRHCTILQSECLYGHKNLFCRTSWVLLSYTLIHTYIYTHTHIQACMCRVLVYLTIICQLPKMHEDNEYGGGLVGLSDEHHLRKHNLWLDCILLWSCTSNHQISTLWRWLHARRNKLRSIHSCKPSL
jgi:hypothetical protein